MIITCPNCEKKFQIDAALVPENGRDLQCGSCNHAWFYKPENENEAPLALNENTFVNKEKTKIECVLRVASLTGICSCWRLLPTHTYTHTHHGIFRCW